MGKVKNQATNAQTKHRNLTEKFSLQLAVFHEISQLIGQEEKAENIIQAALHHLLHTLDYYAAQIYRLTPSGRDLWLFLKLGPGSKPLAQNAEVFSVEEENIVSHTIQKNGPVYVPDFHQESYSYYGQDDKKTEINSELSLPLKYGQSPLGVLRIQSRKLNDFDESDINFLTSLANLLASVIKTQQTVQDLRDNLQEIGILYDLRHQEELTLLFETSRQLSETIDLNQIYLIVSAQIINYLNADYCGISLLNEAKTHFKIVVEKQKDPIQDGNLADTTSGKPIPENIDESPLLQKMLKNPVPIMSHLEDPAAFFQSLTIFPLLVRNNLVGVLTVGYKEESRAHTQNELQSAQVIISQLSVAVQNAQLFEQTHNALAETQKLYELSRSIVESTTLEEIFEVVLGTVKAFGIDRVSISLLDRDQIGKIEGVTIVASWDSESNQILPVGTAISSEMFPLVETFAIPPFVPLISEDLSRSDNQDERMDEGFRLFMYKGLGAMTMFSIPMFLGSDYKGVLSISTRVPHVYTPLEIRIYETLSDQAIIAIERHRLLEETRRERDRAALLFKFGQKLSQTVTLNDILETVISFSNQLGATHGEIFITDDKEFFTMASTILERQSISPEQAKILDNAFLSRGTEADTLNHSQIILKKRSEQNGWFVNNNIVENHHWIQSIIATRFHSRRSDLHGVLTFFASTEDVFTKEHFSMLKSMAIQISATLENIWLLQQMAVALTETELLYKVTRDFNSAQHIEDLLVTLVERFTVPRAQIKLDINHMSIALIPALAENGAPARLNIMASWDEVADSQKAELLSSQSPKVSTLKHSVNSQNYPFISNLRPDAPVMIEPDSLEGTAEYLEKFAGKAQHAISVPLVVGKNWLGVLFLASRAKKFTPELSTINQILVLAGHAAVVIQNLRLMEETQQNLFYSEILSHLSQELLVSDTLEAIYELSLNAVAATEPSRGAAVFMYDQVEGSVELELVSLLDNPGQEWPPISPGMRFSTEELGLVPLLRTGQTLVSDNVRDHPHFNETLQQLLSFMQVQSLAAVPVWLNKEVNGFILVGNRETDTFSPDTLRLYENIGRLMSGALQNRYLFEQAEYRATQLQTAAEVSQAATSYLDLDTLLSQSVDLIRDRFAFYHVSIFLVDEYQKYAVVEASTGKIGQKMLAMKHKLAVGGKSIVGTATSTAKPRITLDVGQDAVHFNNPLLPHTRSEMALPLLARGRVIGALDVQSTKQNAFSKSDINILQSMANQLANAIEAARSYQRARFALEEVNRFQEHYLRDEWSRFLREQKNIRGYRLTEQGFVTIEEANSESKEYRALLTQAIEAKHPIVFPSLYAGSNNKSVKDRLPENHTSSADSADVVGTMKKASTLVAPLKIREQVPIGAIDFELSDESITDEEDLISLIETVASQAAQAIEAARLFEETQAAREEAEALYEVGRALVTAESQQEMFHTVLREMLSTLGLKQGGILFFETDRKFGKLQALFIDGKPMPPELRIPVDGNPSYEKLIETKKPVSIVDFASDPLVAPVREINPDHKISSLLLVPIIVNDEVIGALGADSVEEQHQFTDREFNLVVAMADQLSLILQNRRLLEESRRRAIQLQTSSDVGRVATSILDQDSMLESAVELIRDRFGFYHVQVFLTDELKKSAILNNSTGVAGQRLLGTNYRVEISEQNLIGQAASQHRSIVIRDTGSEKSGLTLERHEYLPKTRAELAIPLQVGKNLIGVLDVHSISVTDFTNEDIDTLETLAAQIAIAIQNARAFREQQETAERLKEVDKLKTQFLANMSHELRTPLNSIIGFSRVILKGIDGPLTELQKTDLTSIYNSGQHLLGLINNVLDLSKIEAGKMELNFEEVKVAPIIKGVMSTAGALVKDKPVELIQEIPDDLPQVWADPTRLRQITLNLVSNACKFTDEGEVILRVSAEKEKIIFNVSDTGVGIEGNKLDTIFEEFIQVDASTTRKVGGTGLGLPISRHFVEMHQGQIWVESVPGKGSTFCFAIPIKPKTEEPEIAEATQVTGSKDGQGKTIIAIDDDPGVINLYKRFLKKRNYNIVGVNETKQVIDIVKMHAPFAILLDILLPEKDGWNILKELKQDPFTRDIPVIICSIRNEKNRGLTLGAVDYLTKPIVEGELVNALQNLDTQQKDQIKVLVIDDQADDILLIRRILEAQNYRIIEASNGNAGLDLARSRQPDLIILDLRMPEMDGFAVVEALKRDEQTSKIPIIIVSAKELTSQEHKFLSGQVEVLLRKGIFTHAELLKDVVQVLEKSQARIPIW